MRHSKTTHQLRFGRMAAQAALALLCPGILAAQATPEIKIVETDQFKVQIIDQYDRIWDDAGSGAKRDVTVFRPKSIVEGYYFFGDVAVPLPRAKALNNLPNSFAVQPLPGFENRLAPPRSLRWVYDDAGTGFDENLVIYMANCPTGYVALGAVTLDSSKIGTGEDIAWQPDNPEFARIRNYRCISENNVMQATWLSEPAWNPLDHDDNKLGDHDGSLWETVYTGGLPPPGTLVVNPRAIHPSPSNSEQPPMNEAWVLKLAVKDVPNLTEPVGLTGKELRALYPKLTGPFIPDEPAKLSKAITYEVPFFMVNDPKYSQLEQWMKVPTYKVVQTVYYEFNRDYDNTASCAVPSDSEGQLSYTAGGENTASSGWEAGGAFTLGFSTSLSVEANAGVDAGISLGGSVTREMSWSAEFSASYNQSGENSNMQKQETQWQQAVPRGTYAAMYLKTSRYEIYRNGPDDKEMIKNNKTAFDHQQPVFLAWAPEGWSAGNPCGWYWNQPTPATAATGDAGAAAEIVVHAMTQQEDAPHSTALPARAGLQSCSIKNLPCDPASEKGYYLEPDMNSTAMQGKIVEYDSKDQSPVIQIEREQDPVLKTEVVYFKGKNGRYLEVKPDQGFMATFTATTKGPASAFIQKAPLEGSVSGYASFAMAAMPNHWIRHRGMLLFAEESDDSALFKKDATWRIVNRD